MSDCCAEGRCDATGVCDDEIPVIYSEINLHTAEDNIPDELYALDGAENYSLWNHAHEITQALRGTEHPQLSVLRDQLLALRYQLTGIENERGA